MLEMLQILLMLTSEGAITGANEITHEEWSKA